MSPEEFRKAGHQVVDWLADQRSAEERQVFRRHILWTRILSDRRTLLPDGQNGDLLPYVRREYESLVLKPNRNYGG